MGKGEDVRHDKVTEAPEHAEVSMDFCCMGTEGPEDLLTILTARGGARR